MKFRRNNPEPTKDAEENAPVEPVEAGEENPRAEGPWDSSEVELGDEETPRVDLGGLIITGRPGVELRLQVDEASQRIVAVLIVGEEGAVELRPFAASRNSDIWDDIRGQIAAETTRLGGTVTEVDGPYGKELQVLMTVTDANGNTGVQPSRVLGISGPRWFLRATLLGKPAVEPDHDGVIESALRDVVVVRGSAAMAPGDPLPLVLPAGAKPLGPQE